MKNKYISIKKYNEIIMEASDILKEVNCYSKEILKIVLYNVLTNDDDIESMSKDKLKQIILDTKIDLSEFYKLYEIKKETETETKDEQKSIIIDYKDIEVSIRESNIYHICPICGAVIQTGNRIFNFEEFDCEKCGGHIMPKYKVDTIYPDYYEVTVRHISPYKTLTDIIINKQVCTSFEDVMKFIYDFHNITDVKITTNTINRSLYVPGKYFNYRRYNFAEDYISNFLLQNVKYEK